MVRSSKIPLFKPDLSPEEIFKRGSFGGNYWRPIYSDITKEHYVSDYLEFPWFKNMDVKLLCNPIYDKNLNFYKVACGLGLEDWEKKGWIKAQDPRGWVQWYCRYYSGRRSVDDDRQIGRWLRINRFKNLLKKHPFSNKLKQVLLHWAIDPEKI